jgi:hypothetical protein
LAEVAIEVQAISEEADPSALLSDWEATAGNHAGGDDRGKGRVTSSLVMSGHAREKVDVILTDDWSKGHVHRGFIMTISILKSIDIL